MSSRALREPLPPTVSVDSKNLFVMDFESPRPWTSFLASYALQFLGLVLLVRLAALAPAVLPVHPHYESIELAAAPAARVTEVEPVRKTITAPRVPEIAIATPHALAAPVRPQVEPPPAPVVANTVPPPPVISVPVTPKPKVIATGMFDAAPSAGPRNPAVKIETGGFAGSSAAATVKLAARQVQTGGFGDPNGIAGHSDRAGLHAAAVGSFDLPSGDGVGNGTDGARGVRGTVASAGFGNGIAGPGSGDRGGHHGSAAIAGSAFADSQPARVVPAAARTVVEQTTPVEILDKPAPVYSQEARRLKIEGEVLLHVVFGADGSIHEISVVRGLGHGLDEAAVAAARKLRFHPAHRGSQPVDYSTTIHVLFQLA